MVDKVYSVSGNKISSAIIDENSLKFSSATFKTVDAFREAFAKKLSLSTKVEIKYDSIKHIRKEENDDEVTITYKNSLGLPVDCEFSFNGAADCEEFFTFFEKQKQFTKSHETLTPFKAVRNYGIGLIATIGFTIFSYFQAIDIANGVAEEAHSRKARLFYNVVGLLGDKGVLAVGGLVSCFLIYKIWTRFSNPPGQIKLLPPNA